MIVILVPLLLLCATFTHALNNGLALTPQMGWNSWNHYGCDVSEDLIIQTANAILKSGLAGAGYRYINLDDCWQVKRDAQGNIIADPQKFPSGIPYLADYLHTRGLALGLYSDAGLYTCQGRPGSYGYEIQDANTYAQWGIDYLKYDNCYNLNVPPQTRYPRMRDALNVTGAPILYSICEWGVDSPWTWAMDVGNSWRTTTDISDNWDSMYSNINANDVGHLSAGPGAWNDPDMLEVGNGGMTHDEYVTHFSLWALAKSPLIIGMDVTTIDNDTLAIVTNPDVIAINQDSLGVQGWKVNSTVGDVWAGPLTGGVYVAALVNPTTAPLSMTLYFTDVGLPPSTYATLYDVWKHETIGTFFEQITQTINPHATLMVTLAKTNAPADEPIEIAKI